jgi:hypothetical protein
MKNNKKTKVSAPTSGGGKRFSLTPGVLKWSVLLFFAAVWLAFVLYENVQLQRIQELSTFLCTEMYFDDMMTAPAGLLSYVATFLVQFLYYPVLGVTIYMALMYVVYLLVRKLFAIPQRWSLLALVPVVLLLWTNVYMGYWIYYSKLSGYFFVALLGVIAILAAMLAYKRVPGWAKYPFIAVWTIAGYPLIGVYALAAAIMMGAYSIASDGKAVSRILLPLLSVALVAVVPALYYYNCYTSTAFPLMYGAGTPVYQWSLFGEANFASHVWVMWMPYVLLFLFLLVGTMLSDRIKEGEKTKKHYSHIQIALFVALPCVLWLSWFTDENYHAELAQNKAMWDEDWNCVADLGMVSGEPTRLVVINRNIALLRSGRAGEEMFHFPDGSSTMKSGINVRLSQTGGKMMYYQYGRFSFCYRWCVEDAVEYGWRIEYIKHAVRSLMASGQYKLAHRYTDMLKHTIFHRSWAERYEKMIENPLLIDKAPEIAVPRQLFCYKNTLDVDESFVEAYLMNVMVSNLYVNPSPICTEASLMFALIRKDIQLYWNTMVAYLGTHSQLRIPTHYQEALLLYANLDRRADISKFKLDNRVVERFRKFSQLSAKYKGMSEEEMAPYFKDEFGDTYWYFYFFVRDIRTN